MTVNDVMNSPKPPEVLTATSCADTEYRAQCLMCASERNPVA